MRRFLFTLLLTILLPACGSTGVRDLASSPVAVSFPLAVKSDGWIFVIEEVHLYPAVLAGEHLVEPVADLFLVLRGYVENRSEGGGCLAAQEWVVRDIVSGARYDHDSEIAVFLQELDSTTDVPGRFLGICTDQGSSRPISVAFDVARGASYELLFREGHGGEATLLGTIGTLETGWPAIAMEAGGARASSPIRANGAARSTLAELSELPPVATMPAMVAGQEVVPVPTLPPSPTTEPSATPAPTFPLPPPPSPTTQPSPEMSPAGEQPASSSPLSPTLSVVPVAPTATEPPVEPSPSLSPLLIAAPPTVPPPATEGAHSSSVIIVAVNKVEEYVDIRNTGDEPQALVGWILRSEKGMQDCPLDGVLPASATLRIWSAAESPADGEYTCGFATNIWNNSEEDPAVLLSPTGEEVSRQ